jgi:predicted alpha-1,2-mannosidase
MAPYRLTVLATAVLLQACALRVPLAPAPGPVRAVDPLIGTGISTTESAREHSESSSEPKGQTFPAVGVPFGMTQLTPQTRDGAAKCVSPYYHADTRIQGFRASHWISGSCTQDYGSFTLMPLSGRLDVLPEVRASRFSHARERATPAYYAVTLDDEAIRAEATGSARAGFLRFTFPRGRAAYVVVNPNSEQGLGALEVHPDAREIVGYNPVYRLYAGQGTPAGFNGYFVARFDTPFEAYGTWENGAVRTGARSVEGDSTRVGAYVRFAAPAGGVVRVRIGTSFTSLDEARRNLDAEIPDWNFDRVRAAAEDAWNDALGAVQIRGGSETDRTIFYSALYHAMLLPRVLSDVDGSYPSFAGGDSVRVAEGFAYYDDFSLWDTFRAVHPLLVLLAPHRAGDMVRSLLAKAEDGGWLPIFPAWNSYTSAMIGDHAAVLVADAYLKGVRGFDAERLYGYMRKNATESPPREEYLAGRGRRALASYLKYGYVPLEDGVPDAAHRNEQVSRTLEYAFDDFAVAQMAGALGHDADRKLFLERAGNWRKVFDPSVGLVRGRSADGSWATSFDPTRRASYITEGTPWQYTWFVPHDVAGLVGAMGGRESFVARLDTLFDGGLYWHGNEPNHHIAYLYDYAGAPWKTQERVSRIRAEEYDAGAGGLSGNDDAGQMSAWYVFSALGLYPVAPGTPYYALGTPLFPEASIRVAGGKRFTIRAEGVSKKSPYVQAAWLNGEPLDRAWISHEEITAGGTLLFRMGPTPNRAWASDPLNAPPGASVDARR